jgi:GNAT superfamily N-acetyltransferase
MNKRLRALWRHVEYNFHEGGLRQVLSKIAYRIRRWFSAKDEWLIYEIHLPAYSRSSKLDLAHAVFDFEDLQRLGYFKTTLFPEALRQRIAAGILCHGFLVEGKLANVGWISRGFLELEGGGFSLTEDAAAGIYDCYTDPSFRGQGIYPNALILMLRQLKEQGLTTALIAVDPGNLPSIKGIERAGFQPRYRLTRTRRFGRTSLKQVPFRPLYPE